MRSLAWLLAVACLPSYAESPRAWTPEDSVAVRYFVTQQAWANAWERLPGQPLAPSPDGQYVFFVTHHGDLSCDCNIYELRLFAAPALLHALKRAPADEPTVAEPLRSVSFRSPSNAPAIGNARWDEQGRITFQAVEESARQRIYRLDPRSGALTALTPELTHTFSYEYHGVGLVYDAFEEEPRDELDHYPMVAVTGYAISAALGVPQRSLLRLSAAFAGQEPFTLALLAGGASPFMRPRLSPDGTKAVMMVPQQDGAEVPAGWAAYGERKALVPQNFPRFMRVDLPTRRIEPVFDAPAGQAVGANWIEGQALWSPDSRHVILVNTALPLSEDRTPPESEGHHVVQHFPYRRVRIHCIVVG